MADIVSREQKCADLARAMGWKLAHHGYGLSPDYPAVPQPRALPNPYESAADSPALVAWLLDEDSDAQWNEIVFLSELMKNYSYLWQPGKVGFNAGGVRLIIFRALTAPLNVIADAAWLAITSAGRPKAS